jgi:EAL domain-containing protein (putative c-di-GMP-specific phosphodiesterase class I)
LVAILAPASQIEFEITEGLAMLDNAVEMMKSLKSLGVRLALDDFGTGYSSLGYLNRLPIDTLKIDQSSVRNLADSEENHTIVKTIVALESITPV